MHQAQAINLAGPGHKQVGVFGRGRIIGFEYFTAAGEFVARFYIPPTPQNAKQRGRPQPPVFVQDWPANDQPLPPPKPPQAQLKRNRTA